LYRLTAAVIFGALLSVGLSSCASLGPGRDRAVIGAKNKVAPALVHIRPVQEVFTGGRREERQVVGSGFIVSRDGYVVTNNHVAGDSSLVRCVLSSKEEVDAEVVGADPFTDLAVLKLKTGRTNLPVATFAKGDTIEAGQTVIAMGSPHGLARSVSLGIVSVTDRYLGGSGEMAAPFNNWIQTDAAINPGNSGGPLVNMRGEVIGVNARRLPGAENVGFAIPVSIARDVVREIIEHGHVRRSWLGLGLQEMMRKTDDPTQQGVIISFIDPLSPCADSGLAPGDILKAINSEPVHARFVEDLPAVRNHIAELPTGEEATLTVLRGDEKLEFTVTPAERFQLKGEEVEFEAWGFTASEITPVLARRAQLPDTNGVVVTGAQVGGYAENAGLQTWDVVLTMDGEPVKGLEDFRDKYRERVTTGQEFVLMDVRNIRQSSLITRYVLLEQRPDEEDEMVEEGVEGAE